MGDLRRGGDKMGWSQIPQGMGISICTPGKPLHHPLPRSHGMEGMSCSGTSCGEYGEASAQGSASNIKTGGGKKNNGG